MIERGSSFVGALAAAALWVAAGVWIGGAEVAGAGDYKPAPEEDAPVAAPAGPFRRHLLKVAAHPSLRYTNAYVDGLLRSISEIIQTRDFAWDIACDVDFVRDGDVISDSRLALSGTDDELMNSIAAVAPDANVIVVANITDCAHTGAAAGCAPLVPLRRDAMAVIHDGSPRGFIVWLHERGHVKSLGHVAEGSRTPTAQELGQTMFWNPQASSRGVVQAACDKFRTPSRTTIGIPVPDMQVAASSPPPMPTYGLPSSVLDIVVGSALPTTEAVAQLTDADLDAVERVLSGEFNDYWRQLLFILSYRRPNSPRTIQLIQRSLGLPAPGASGTPADEAARKAVVARFSAIFMLGVVGYRADDAAPAARVLANIADLSLVPVAADPSDTTAQARAAALESAAVIAGRGTDRLGQDAKQTLVAIHPILLGDVAVAADPALPQQLTGKVVAIRDSVARKGLEGFLTSGVQ